MNYVKHILLPNEQVLYDGHVHPTVLLPGALLLGIAAFLLTMTGNTGNAHSVIIGFTHFLGQFIPPFAALHDKFVRWHYASPYIDFDLKVVALCFALYGLSRLIQGFIVMETTELVVTDQRIIAKSGIMTVTTVEMDRRRIAGVTIYQSVAGRIMGYGTVLIQGFTSHIGGLPPMVNPHLVEKFVS